LSSRAQAAAPLWLQAMDAAYSGPLPNHNSFWKWDPKAPKVALYNNIGAEVTTESAPTKFKLT